MEDLELSATLGASARRIYHAWLDSREHCAFTGSQASIDPALGGGFSAGDGYIRGTTLELEPDRRIVQAWRTTDFPPDSPDSRLEVVLEPLAAGTRLTLHHSGIPAGQAGEYRQGWIDYYLEPMKAYFATPDEKLPTGT